MKTLIKRSFSVLFFLFLAQPAFADYWTVSTSEEYPPITLNNQYVVSGANCSGRYCDNIQFRAHDLNRNRLSNYWTSYFSEEGTNYRYCGTNRFVTGVACKGRYCDNVSLQCSSFSGVTRGSCYWTGWFSEESGVKTLASGYHAAGMQCSGAYCDNKRIYACRANL